MITTHVRAERLARAKSAYTTRRVDFGGLATLIRGEHAPRSGDLVLARVVEIGQHTRIERRDGRMATLFVDDEVVVCYGHRYASDQFEAEVPNDLSPCHLVAGGGVASSVLASHALMLPPTVLEPIGLIGDRDGRPANLKDYALPRVLVTGRRPFTLAVVGTSMNAGKTDTVANLIRGLARAGCRVGAAKVTGTGAGKDIWLMVDAGADPALDFTSAGFPSTYLATPSEIGETFDLLTDHLQAAGADVVVLEVADGVYQAETSDLVSSQRFGVDGVLVAAGDALGATAVAAWLRERDLPVLGVVGRLTASPLALREAAAATGLPIFDRQALSDPEIGPTLGVQRRPQVETAAD